MWRELFRERRPALLSLRSSERVVLSGPGGLRHGLRQLPLVGDVQHAVVVLDHLAQGLQVALDEAGDDLALEAAILALIDDPLADDEFPSKFARSSGRRPPRLQVQNCSRSPFAVPSCGLNAAPIQFRGCGVGAEAGQLVVE